MENAFNYTYSAQENQEVLNIRKKYLPREENKLDELKRLDRQVQSSGVTEALCAGIGGALLFGVGFCLTTETIGNFPWLGVILGLLGMAAMIVAFPVYRRNFHKAKAENAPRILNLIAELNGEIQYFERGNDNEQ